MDVPAEKPNRDVLDARLKAVLDTAVDGIIVIDIFGRIQLFNRACERLFGYPAKKVIGENVKILMPGPYHEEHDDYLQNYRTTGKRKIIGIGREVLGQRSDGSTFPMELSVGEGEEGDERFFVGVIRNISERKEAEEALRLSEARLRTLIDTAVDGVVIMDERGQIEIFNRACERMFGYPSFEAVGRNVKMLMPSPYAEEHDGYLAHYLNTGQRKIIGIGREVVGRRRDGSVFPMDLSVGEALRGGERIFIGIVRDITSRKEAEKAIQSTIEELEAFSYSVAHDLKAPLRATASFAEALVEDYGDQLDDDAHDYLNRIIAGVTRMDRLINDLLAYSRVGSTDSHMTYVDLSEVYATVMDILEPQIEETHAEVTTKGRAPTVYGDRHTLETLFQNLMTNAIKFVPKETTPKLCIEFNTAPTCHQISFVDNGIGVESEHRQRIFDIFQRLHSNEVYTGTGIGLAIVKKAVALHKGDISVADNPLGGSIFTVKLPRRPIIEDNTPTKPTE